MSDLFGSPVRVEPVTLSGDFRLTPAMRRVLEKARKVGHVHRVEAFGGAAVGAQQVPEADFGELVDRCVAAGWLTFGKGFNTYPITAAGEAALIAHENGSAVRQDRARERRNEMARQRRHDRKVAA